MSKLDTSSNSQFINEQDDLDQYYSDIKTNIDSGKYFKDAFDWYSFRYVYQICDRAYLVMISILLLSLIYVVKSMSDSLFPLVVSQPIFVSATKNPDLVQRIVKLKPRKGEPNFDPFVENFDDSIIKYLLKNYVINREKFDFKDGRVEEINKKFNRIKSTSNFREFKNFQKYMSKDNPSSPIKLFSKNAYRDVIISEVKFYRPNPKNFAEKIVFFIANAIPYESDVS